MHQVIEEVALEHQPVVWEMLPEVVKAEVVTKAVEVSKDDECECATVANFIHPSIHQEV